MKTVNKYVSLLMCIPVVLLGFINPLPEWIKILRVFLIGIQTWALVNYAYKSIKGE